MDADRALKALFTMRAGELLALTGDQGARVVSRLVPELPAVTRRADFVMKLRRGREVYLGHVEFEMRYKAGFERRVFEYASALAVRNQLPVVCTAILLSPPEKRVLAYQERVGGRLVCWRPIRVVRLWDVDPVWAMSLGPGGAALVGLMHRASLGTVASAARQIRREAPDRQFRDLSAVLRMLSERRYTARELQRIIPIEVVMGSSLFATVKRLSRAEGARRLCLGLARDFHRSTLPTVSPLIRASTSLTVLEQWARAAPRLTDDAFVELVRSSTDRGSRARAPRPRRGAQARAKQR